MSVRQLRIDGVLVGLLATLLVSGLLIFASAAFGLLARDSLNMKSVVFSHLILGVGGGLIGLIIGSFIDFKLLRRYSLHLFIFASLLTALVFIPHIGAEHGGGRRWVSLGFISFQPSEVLKIATILLSASYFAAMGEKARTTRYGLLGFLGLIAIPSTLLILQPDLGTLGVIVLASLSIFFAAGARWRDIGILCVVALVALTVLATFKPYVRDRITTFFSPSTGQQQEGYQIRQSLIAIGSGGLTGRGLGQGIQKFTYLPEPMGDSIFAVLGEELGFIGSVGLIVGFLLFGLRGYYIATVAPDVFSRLVATGITAYLVLEAFINISSMIGIAPLTGIPLTFVSQGGSAMCISLASAGLLIGISRRRSLKRV